MKKIIAICGAILLLTSCTKEELNKTYCAYCTELITGSSNTSYCGNSSEVDAYIENMESNDPASSGVWSCYKEEQYSPNILNRNIPRIHDITY